MTTVVRWGGSDQRRQSSIYLASDSKLTYPTKHELGRKTFACKNAPYIFGFCGQAALPFTAIPKLVLELDRMYGGSMEITESIILAFVKNEINPAKRRYSNIGDCHIMVCGRNGENMSASFFSYVITYTLNRDCVGIERPDYLKKNNFYQAWGSGEGTSNSYNTAWEVNTDSGGFSRAIFSGFYDSICSCLDLYTLPPPQLVGIWATGAPIDFCLIWNSRIYQGGTRVPSTSIPRTCMDRLFQIIDPLTMDVAVNEQRHAFYDPPIS
jgi:hypothetical protein